MTGKWKDSTGRGWNLNRRRMCRRICTNVRKQDETNELVSLPEER